MQTLILSFLFASSLAAGQSLSNRTPAWDDLLALGIRETPFDRNYSSDTDAFWYNRMRNEYPNGCSVQGLLKKCLPSLIIIGQALFEDGDHYVEASSKELNLYTRKERDSEYEFLYKLDRMEIPQQGVDDSKPVIEASPYYFSSHIDGREDITRFIRYVPHVKFIVLVRNPIDRAYSDFMMLTEKSPELQNSSFFETLVREEVTVNGPSLETDTTLNYARLVSSKKWSRRPVSAYHMGRLLRWGKYSIYAENWMRLYNSSQMLFVKSEDLQTDPNVLKRIFEWVGLSQTNQTVTLSNVLHCKNAPDTCSSAPAIGRPRKMSNSLQSDLLNVFKLYNDHLERLTGLDLREWGVIT